MNTFKKQIIVEQKRIQRLIDLTDPPRPDGIITNLSVETRRGRQYCYEYRYENGKRVKRKYLGTPDSPSVQELAREHYRAEQLRRLQNDQELLQRLGQEYQDYDPAAVFSALPKSCRSVLGESAFNARYEEIRQWANADYQRNTAPFLDSENFAADGTRTRSKGETIFYNTFLDMGVLFRFDCVLVYVDQDGVEHLLYPDFLIKCFDGHLIAIEHLGWYGGLNYGIKFGKKSYYYLQQGFILGKNYFVTSDEKNGGTDSQAIQEIAQLVQKQFFGY